MKIANLKKAKLAFFPVFSHFLKLDVINHNATFIIKDDYMDNSCAQRHSPWIFLR